MALEISGRIHKMFPPVTVEKNGHEWTTARIWLDASRRNPFTGEVEFENFPEIEFRGKNCDLLLTLGVGDIVKVTFDLQGRTYADKNTGELRNFTRAQGYRVEKVTRYGGTANTPQQSAAPAQTPAAVVEEEKTELPF